MPERDESSTIPAQACEMCRLGKGSSQEWHPLQWHYLRTGLAGSRQHTAVGRQGLSRGGGPITGCDPDGAGSLAELKAGGGEVSSSPHAWHLQTARVAVECQQRGRMGIVKEIVGGGTSGCYCCVRKKLRGDETEIDRCRHVAFEFCCCFFFSICLLIAIKD